MTRRHANVNWPLPETDDGRLQSWSYVRLAVLMDIRDELSRIRAVLECPNALEIPRTLRSIRAAMYPSRRRKGASS